jgi:hypothetical protein
MNHTKFHCPRPKTLVLAVCLSNHTKSEKIISFTMHPVKIPTGKTLSREQKRASFELWKAKVPLKEIRCHIQMAKVTPQEQSRLSLTRSEGWKWKEVQGL